tara:strand:- start:4801 stop:5340 length:540 start_codon:yes stop_codon:yes gene_type:complete
MPENVFELTQELLNLDEIIEESGLESDEFKAQLEVSRRELSDDFDNKVASFLQYHEDRMAVAGVLRDRGNALLERARSMERRAKHVKAWLLDLMKTIGKTKVESGEFVASVRKAGGKLVLDIHDPAEVLKDERFVLIRREVDRDTLRRVLAEQNDGKEQPGASVPGAIFQERSEYLHIK